MLNELSQVVAALERLGVVITSQHARMKPMSKNRELLIVRLNESGQPSEVEFIPKDKAAKLLRVEHGSAGSSFPGLNLPAPLLTFSTISAGELSPALEQLYALWKKPSAQAVQIAGSMKQLAKFSRARQFTPDQCNKFKMSVVDLVEELQPLFTQAPPELTNFTHLLRLVAEARPALPQFSQSLSEALICFAATADRETLLLVQKVLFGILDWKKRAVGFGSSDYWKEKAEQDGDANQPLCLDLVATDHRFKPVAHPATSELVNRQAIKGGLKSGRKGRGKERLAETGAQPDAFSGTPCELADVFPEPTIAQLGPFKLFSAHKQNPCLSRYGRIENDLFPVSKALVQRMSDALRHLGKEEQRGKTCKPIPSAQPGKRDLLIAYLEELPDFDGALADLFGGEAQNFSDADFAAQTQPVLEALEGKLKTDPSLKVRLLALCSLDKGRKQISLHRQFRAQDIVRAAQTWKAGAANTPPVSVWFYDEQAKKPAWRTHEVPYPLDVVSVINRVWRADAKAGFTPSVQRAVTPADAYDVFFADSPLSENQTHRCLALLLSRMGSLFSRFGAVKRSGEWRVRSPLSDMALRQCAKAVSLLGVFLLQLGYSKHALMKDTIYQIGRLLALADSLHFQYCKWVRTSAEKRQQDKVDAPGELIGNAVFNLALDQPKAALARLAERIRPYRAWADTYSGEGSGLIHWFVRQMGDCERQMDLSQVPERMQDIHKAQLFLGYLGDNPKSKDDND
jgi:hypothetical protein